MFETNGEEETDDAADRLRCIDCTALAAAVGLAGQTIGSKPAAQGIRLLPAAMRKQVDPECLL
jgi:hypothetical protein